MLHIVLGPMCAGKTSKLINDYETFTGTKMIIDYDITDKDILSSSPDGLAELANLQKSMDSLDVLMKTKVCKRGS